MWQKVRTRNVITFGLIWPIIHAVGIYFIVDAYNKQGSAWESAYFIIVGLAYMDTVLILALIINGIKTLIRSRKRNGGINRHPDITLNLSSNLKADK